MLFQRWKVKYTKSTFNHCIDWDTVLIHVTFVFWQHLCFSHSQQEWLTPLKGSFNEVCNTGICGYLQWDIGTHFTYNLSFPIPICWKHSFVPSDFLIKYLLQILHMTVLSWHVQKFHNNNMDRYGIAGKRSFNKVWIAMENALAK